MKHAPPERRSDAVFGRVDKRKESEEAGMRGGRRRWRRVAFRLAAPPRFRTSPFRMGDGERERERIYDCAEKGGEKDFEFRGRSPSKRWKNKFQTDWMTGLVLSFC